jgi:ferredoxin
MLCNIIAPAVFGSLEEDGHAVVLLDEIPADLLAAARRSVASCPEQAIRLVE